VALDSIADRDGNEADTRAPEAVVGFAFGAIGTVGREGLALRIPSLESEVTQMYSAADMAAAFDERRLARRADALGTRDGGIEGARDAGGTP